MSRILAIEDSAAIRLLLTRRLGRCGHEVVAVATAREGLRLLTGDGDAGDPDLILLDLGLPGENSGQALAAISRERPGAPVILLSARSDLDRAATPVPVAGRVSKPIDFDLLLELIAGLTGTSGRPG